MVYAFEGFELDADRFELRRPDGEVIPLRRQALDVLLYLVARRDRMLSKAEITAAIWAGVAVSDTALPQAIVAIRRALGDGEEGRRFVETVRGRGYRFVAPAAERPRAESDARPGAALVGRDGALAALDGLLRAAASGRGGVALLSGDAGAGRTRIALELVDRSRAAGSHAAFSSCDEESRAVELWPWLQLVRTVLGADATPAPALIAAWLAPSERIARNEADDRRSPIALFDAVLELLRDASMRRPRLLVIDDVDAADVGTLLLVRLAARRLQDARALLLVSYRDASVAQNRPLARTVGTIARDDPTRHVTLSPLGRDDVARLARSFLGVPADDALVDRLVEKTGGNVQLLAQLLHSMRTVGKAAIASTSALLAVGDMREAIHLHLERLSPSCRALLEGAAVLGPSFSLVTLAATLASESASLLDAVDEAVVAKVISPEPGAARYRFRHALERDVLYARLPSSRRVALHDRAAQALEAAGGAAQATAHRERVRALLGHG